MTHKKHQNEKGQHNETMKKCPNIDISGIRELKCAGIKHLESEDLTADNSGHEKQKRISNAFIVRKKTAKTILGSTVANDKIISIVIFMGNPLI